MFHNSKKGFTIVELVIVIAVVAILAAVLIPTFAGLINKANLSNDQQMVTNMNKTLAVEFPGGKPESAGAAITALASNGFYGDKLDTYSKGFHYAYNLEENKFYLVNDKNEAVYPSACSLDKLWGLYGDNSADYIEGVSHYVATTSIKNSSHFEVFNEGTYTIDLNKDVITVDSTNKANITLMNGTTTVKTVEGGENYILENVEVMELYTSTDGNKISETLDGMVIDLTKSYDIPSSEEGIVIENCVFMGNDAENEPYFNVTGGTNIIIRNCTFVNQNAKYALTFYGSCDSVVIQNNEFYNCRRGINFNYFYGNVVIEGNTFNLSDAINPKDIGKNNAIQLPSVGKSTFEIKNNNFVNATAAVSIHCGYIKDNANATIIFSNNTLGENVQSVVPDPGYKDELNTTQQEKMESVVADLKAKFN